jgi:alpha-1,3-glucosyltransferase
MHRKQTRTVPPTSQKLQSTIHSHKTQNCLTMTTTTPTSTSLFFLLVGFVTLLRILVGLQPHSGQDNYHGSNIAYGGDFEAQRHWMELTLHLPIHEWYWYDLQYWGLDYPPLTAYISYICGLGSARLVSEESVALETSRGYEDKAHKAYMRATVLVLDLVIFGSAVWISTIHNKQQETLSSSSQQSSWLWTILIALSQPAIILIDHGHFQYNTVALGWSIFAFYYMSMISGSGNSDSGSFGYCIVGSIFFCLALNFKQMTLYYAPAVFCYLLGRCLANADRKQFVARFCALGATVITTFAVIWAPILRNGPPSHNIEATTTTVLLQRAQHVLHRIFPFQRGLFEGKVANLWCALATKPISIRQRVPEELLPLLALVLTFLFMMPSCYVLFRQGRQHGLNQTTTTTTQNNRRRDWNTLLWGTTSCALGFFLASFQVHEKSILLALAPATLLLGQQDADVDVFVEWFSMVCVWTLWPLMQVDRLELAYVCMNVVFLSLLVLRRQEAAAHVDSSSSSSVVVVVDAIPTFFAFLMRWVPPTSYVIMIGLHVLQIVVDVPPHLPDLFPVLWSIVGCGMICFSWLVTVQKLLLLCDESKLSVASKVKIH